jgi:hypothetical protein
MHGALRFKPGEIVTHGQRIARLRVGEFRHVYSSAAFDPRR